MKKPQYITLIVAAAVLILLWAFAKTVPSKEDRAEEGKPMAQAPVSETLTSSFSIDSSLDRAKINLPESDRVRAIELEKSIKSLTDKEQKIHLFHQLSQFWKDTGKAFIPFAWYAAEGARLENSEKNLNFAAHLFLNSLGEVENAEMRKWMALQSKELFERSLSINPENDSAKVGLGATYMFGGISNAPMQGIAKIREVVSKDSNNVYAQMTLAMGALMSGQTDKVQGRLETVIRLDPKNLQAILLLADFHEKQGNKQDALKYYQKALPLITSPAEMKTEIENRINALKKQN